MAFFTYSHQTADTGKIFYIGKGSRKDRQIAKIGRNKHWHNIVKKHGFTAKILAYWDTEQEAFAHEKLLIASFRDMGHKLANYTDGGEGSSGAKITEETRIKLRNRPYKKESYEKVAKALCKKVICIDLNKEFNSGLEAVKWLKQNGHSKATSGAISVGIRKDKVRYGYRWKFSQKEVNSFKIKKNLLGF